MPWVDEEIEQSKILDGLWDKVFRKHQDSEGNYWWQDFNEEVEKVDLYKLTFEDGLLVNSGGEYRPSEIEGEEEGYISITRHIIMRRYDDTFLGMAQSTGAIEVNVSEMPEGEEEIRRWVVDTYERAVDYLTVYVYTMDEYLGYTHYEGEEEAEPVISISSDEGNGVFKASVDIEVFGKTYHHNTMQSPIVTVSLRESFDEGLQIIGKVNYKTKTNWWDDSIVRVWGNMTEHSFFILLQADTAPKWTDNFVTTVPIFFGNLEQKHTEELGVIALFGGRQVPHDFDFNGYLGVEDNEVVVQPINKDYVYNPSNGVDSVMVKRTKRGARYQEHFMRWSVPPNKMPPKREEVREGGVSRQYPRAWNYHREGYYQYTPNPSRYSDKTHVSRAYIVHPEDGVVGYLPNVLLAPLVNISEGEILQRVVNCTECGGEVDGE